MSILKYLVRVTLLSLILGVFNTNARVGAEQIDRSRTRNLEFIPSVTDLNLSIPNEGIESSSIESREQSIAEQSTQNKSKRRKINVDNFNSTASATIEQPIAATSIRRRSLNTNISVTASTAKSISNRNVVNPTIDRSISAKNGENSKSKSSSRQRIATASLPPLSGNYLRLVRDRNKGTNNNGNPIYTLEAYIGGKIYQTFNAVSGVATSQKLDRHIGNNHAPLPDGLYGISNQIVPGTLPEVGKTFIGIQPKFETARTDLGIHVDPSFNKQNGSDGTSGCIGLTTLADRDAVNEFILKYRPRNLLVNILSNGTDYIAQME